MADGRTFTFTDNELDHVVRGLTDLKYLYLARVQEASSGPLTGDSQAKSACESAQQSLDEVEAILRKIEC